MATPKWALTARYQPRDGDCLLLVYKDARHPCFRAGDVPAEIRRAAAPHKDRGGAWTVFAGRIGKATVRARAVRLDAEHATVERGAKRMVARALSSAQGLGYKRIVVFLGPSFANLAEPVHEGALLGGYTFDRYLKKKPERPPVLIVCPEGKLRGVRAALGRRTIVAECVNFARDVLNEPPNTMTPATLSAAFGRMGKRSGLKITTWNAARLERERCGGVLGVGGGARSKPRLVIGEYRPRGAKRHICLVGKGVTFDSGGYGLKPANSQLGMKYDMAGAAMMFSAACAAARLRLPLAVTVITPLVENAISADAYHTTSILRTRSGRTIEVHHTDAEGRIILADALTLAAERKPDWIIDAATLTGACVVALGEDVAGVLGTDAALTKQLLAAGTEEGEDYWELPLHMEYEDLLKSTVADCKNVGSRWGGAITAAVFLKAWVPDGVKWVHCDIAGPGGKEGPLGPLGKGAKGFGVRTIIRLAERLSSSRA